MSLNEEIKKPVASFPPVAVSVTIAADLSEKLGEIAAQRQQLVISTSTSSSSPSTASLTAALSGPVSATASAAAPSSRLGLEALCCVLLSGLAELVLVRDLTNVRRSNASVSKLFRVGSTRKSLDHIAATRRQIYGHFKSLRTKSAVSWHIFNLS